MKLSKESIQEFKEIWEKEYGKELSDEKAEEYGSELLGLYAILFKN